MEKTMDFNDFLDETLNQTESTEETSEDLGIDESETVEEPEMETEEVAETESENDTTIDETESEEKETTPDFKAFAEMRVKAKQLAEEKEKAESDKLKAEALAKKLGYDTLDEMLEEATKREMADEAKKQNIPVEVLERIKKLEDENRIIKEERIREATELKERTLLSTIDTFFESNKLNQKDIESTLNALGEDGFEYETLLELPVKSVEKLLNAYTNKDSSKQKELAEKAKIQKEIPLTPTEKTDAVNKSEEDILLEYFTGQRRDF